MVRQYYEQGAHVLLVDTENSYLGLCDMIKNKTHGKDGVYYAYTTKESEKLKLFDLAEKKNGDIELAIRDMVESQKE